MVRLRPPSLPSFPPLYRHSRVSGNPTVACRQYHHQAVPSWIPAYAGMTVAGAQPPPYRRLRRTVFLQVAIQVRLCRAR